MKKLLLTMLSTFFLLGIVANKTTAEADKKKINIFIDKNMVCVQRTNKCFAFAKGKPSYPTPTWEGAQVLTTHIKNGFKWRNPLTGAIYNKGAHNLGDIWIEFYHDENPNSPTYNWRYGLN